METTQEELAVWLADGRPVRVVWRGERYRVDDQPTPLAEAMVWWDPAITHPQAPEGWRFQARSEADGIARVFDVRQNPDGRWEALRVYE